MQDKVKMFVEHYIKERSRKQKMLALMLVLSLFVVTGVFWKLKLDGIALAGEAFCGQTEHGHSEGCWERVLICGQEEKTGHQHTDDCYELEKNLKCQETEHSHGKECYKSEEVLICSLEENEEHTHSVENGCYEIKEVLDCSSSEHTHGDECYEENRVLICKEPEEQGHTHTDSCYEERLTCQLQEHIHNVMCYSDKGADLESASIWEATLPNELTEEWSQDLITVAKSQLGYEESARNYILAEDGERKKGYSRYGEWYGNAYGDWCAMFVSFCLNYAEIPQEAIPYEAGCHVWTVKLDELGLYEKSDNYIPAAGDIIFFDYDHVGKSHHIGIVTEIEEKENEEIVVHTIEGNSSDRVREKTYSLSDSAIIGYGNLTKVKERYDKLTNPEEDVENVESTENVVYALDGLVAVNNEAELKNAYANNNNVTVQLTADFTVTGTINLAGKEIALDLNGHKLTVLGNASLFQVSNGSELTIIDSKAQPETTANQTGKVYGNIGSYTENGNLTYYVTETKVTNASTGATQETLKKHDVPLSGRIQAGSAVIADVNGGTVNLESGMLYNGTNRAFNISTGTLNLNGGYVFGFKKTGAINTGENNFGGAILATGGTTNISGTVLAVNEALNGGAIYAKNNAVVNLTGGIISGNKSTRSTGNWGDHSEGGAYRCGGGGIFSNGSAVIKVDSGYITNNTASDKAYFDGGGGVLISGTSAFTINGGYVTGNEAAGGGGVRSDWNKKTTFNMNGGFISANYAREAEGGGVAITQGGVGYVRGGYITNNDTNTKVHWGGGGIFCSDGSYLYIWDVNVMENDAGGFGGGVAGCSTGRVYICVKDGGAIYQNSADGEHMSGDGSAKREDHVYGKDSPVFMANGYEDYFCALNSVVEGGMLGGGTANWSGSKDGVAIKDVARDAILEAAYVMGLTANPTPGDIAAAQSQAKVFINGNSSYTHGGGVLCNGYLLIGDKNPIAIGSRFSLSGTKKLLNENGSNSSLSGYKFNFSVKDENGKVVSVGVSDENGNINFDRLLSFNEELCAGKIHNAGERATFVYYLTEDAQQGNLDVTTDPTQYRISVTVTREDQELPLVDADGHAIMRAYYKITGVDVDRSTDGGKTWQDVAYTWTAPGDEQHAGSLKITNGTTFTNRKVQTTSLKVNKKWVGTENLPESITVDLLRDGTVIDTIVLNAENNWSYTWNNLAAGHKYTVNEHQVPGYDTTYTNGDGNDTETVSGWVLTDKIEVGKKYLIVASDNTALTGEPNTGGAYDFDAGNFTSVTIADGMIPVSAVTEEMKWEAVSIGGKLCLKNAPADGKHYLSYQNTDTVKASSSTTGYASQVNSDCSNGLQLYKHNSANDIKFVEKKNNTLKAVSGSANAVKVYALSGEESSSEDVITITNTKVSKLYDLEIKKVSEMDPNKTLAGAKFELRKEDVPLKFKQGEDGKYIYDVDGTITELETDADGMIYITGLPKGNYVLKETKAPEGYELAEDRTVILGEGEETAVQIIVEDKEIQYNLPETGGIGTARYYIGGSLLVLVSVLYTLSAISKKKKR